MTTKTYKGYTIRVTGPSHHIYCPGQDLTSYAPGYAQSMAAAKRWVKDDILRRDFKMPLTVCYVSDWPEANPKFQPSVWKVCFALGALAFNMSEDPFSDDEVFKYSYGSGAFRDGYYQRSEFASLMNRLDKESKKRLFDLITFGE
jgi:hypothetical protein